MYTPEQKQTFLNHVEQIRHHMDAILSIDSGTIINEIGLEGYPFDASFDELSINVGNWIDAINNDIDKPVTK